MTSAQWAWDLAELIRDARNCVGVAKAHQFLRLTMSTVWNGFSRSTSSATRDDRVTAPRR